MADFFDVVVVGGGASGLLACVLLARRGKKVAVLEKQDRVGKKLLATGNGRCNLTNKNLSAHFYNNQKFVGEILSGYGYNDVIETFKELGLECYADCEGRVYPLSNSSSSVLDVLRQWAEFYGVKIVTNFEVQNINKNGNIFDCSNADNLHYHSNVLLYCAGGNEKNLLKKFGHTFCPTKKGLVGLKTDKESVRGLSGLRVKCGVFCDCYQEVGEVQFKDDGISGVCVMNAKSAMNWHNSNNEIYVDFLPDVENKFSFLKERQKNLAVLKTENLFVGLFHKMLGHKILGMSKLNMNEKICKLSDDDLKALVDIISHYKFKIIGEYENSQVSNGGFSTDEISKNFESKKINNLFLLGETLNVDGFCGGFNLSFAFLSAIITNARNSL